MSKSKELTSQNALWDQEERRFSSLAELRLQPVAMDPERWTERARLEKQWRAFNLTEMPELLH